MNKTNKPKKAPEMVLSGHDFKSVKAPRKNKQYPYNEQIGQEICFHISQGKSLRSLEKLGYPPAPTISHWLVTKQDFFEQYIQARKAQALLLAEDALEGVSDRTQDVTGELEIPNHVAVQRDRLIFDARRWYLSKLLPKIFGEKLQVEAEINISLADRISKARSREDI